MFFDKEVVDLHVAGEPVVVLRDQCGFPVGYVRQRTEYGETAEQCLERAARIADKLTIPLAYVE